MPTAGCWGLPGRHVSWVVRNFYRFVDLDDNDRRRERIFRLCKDAGVRGTVLLAPEGINGALAGSAAALDQVLAGLRAERALADLSWRESYAASSAPPFRRLKVICKRQALTFAPRVRPGTATGVAPPAWNQLLQRGDLLLLDVRNSYETALGGFRGARTVPIDSFAEFPDQLRRVNLDPARTSVAMYCTAGIRCEKAGAWMLEQGFREVFQLQGGVLEYFRRIGAGASRWHRQCFVFDDRISLAQDLFESHAAQVA